MVHLKDIFFPVPTVCLQVAYRGWPSSAWEASSSWEPTRRSAVLCYSSTSSTHGQVQSPGGKHLEEGGPLSPGGPNLHSNAAEPLRNQGHLLRGGAVHKLDECYSLFLLIRALQVDLNRLGCICWTAQSALKHLCCWMCRWVNGFQF